MQRLPAAFILLSKTSSAGSRRSDSAAQQLLTSVEHKLFSIMQVHALPMASGSVWVLS
ncbi:unnamed protein product [Ceratitis capitata]|uniref:(Mediterranean fruit fly) hypothetical protein n=1 Tax=Ceratitis capitata TaxID=7213 RepID=A0A811V189_CERCA|nr:unnamed protein product [Ceratitis capitata]